MVLADLRRWISVALLAGGAAWNHALAQSAERPGSSAAGMISGWDRFTTSVMEKSAAFGAALRDFPAQVDRAVEHFGEGRGFVGLLETLALILVVFAVAALLERLASRRLRRIVHGLASIGAQSVGQRLSALLMSAVADAIALALFVVFAVIGIKIAFVAGTPGRELAGTIGLIILVTRLAAIPVRLALNPAAPESRMIPMPDADARRLSRWCIAIAALAAIAYFGSGLLALAGFSKQFVNSWFLIFGLAATAGVLRLIWTHGREPRSPADRVRPGARLGEILSTNYHFIIAALLALSWVIWWVNLVVDQPQQANAVLLSAAIIVLFPPVDRCYRTLLGWAAARHAEEGAPPPAPAEWPLGYRLLLWLTRIALIVAVALLALEAWGVPIVEALASPAGQRITRALGTLAVAVPIAMLVWHGSKAYLERKLGHGRQGGDETPGTRAHTLLPIMRGFLLIVLFVIVAMMVLTSLGVEIGPLLAGAGVVGIAIGFGAQTLVRDIFSGFFFLLDDAFRIGEYIDAGKAKGTVEKISIRSLQLRHHRGALHTVPYGQIQLISNYSRDWVIEKLEFSLVHGTDPEKVRKVVKKVGQEMMQDPELARDMLEPLKSQGVQRFGDSALVFRAKMKCPPGRQFKVRQEAYRRLEKAFTENGIDFAYPIVTVSKLGDDAEAAAAAKSSAKAAVDAALARA